MRNRGNRIARTVAVLYALSVVVTMSLSLWPGAQSGIGLLAVVLALPWGLVIVLLLDTIDPVLIQTLGPPLVGLSGLLNAYLLFNALRSRRGSLHS